MAANLNFRDEDFATNGMRAVIRAFDWSRTPLGPFETWPAHLKFAVSLCENTAIAATLFWGPEYRLIYNDAFARGPAARHPSALGVPAYEVFADIWSTLGVNIERAFRTATGYVSRHQMLPTVRDGIEEEVCWTYCLTPIFDEQGHVAGLFSPGQEITGSLLAERRLSFQIKLADRLSGLDDPDQIKQAATGLLGQYLDVACAGYGEMESAEGTVRIRADWMRPKLGGAPRRLDWYDCALSERSAETLRAGEVMATSDLQTLDIASQALFQETWEAIGGARALIMAPIHLQGELRSILFLHETRPRTWRRSEIATVKDVAQRITEALERAQAERLLRDSEDHYRHTVEFNPQVTWTALADGQLNRVGRRWLEWTGTTGLGDSWASSVMSDERAAVVEAWNRSITTGAAFDIEYRLQRNEGGYRWCRSRAFPRYDREGRICLWYGTTEDIHERKVAEDRQRLLMNELNHRVKNTLATVQAIAFQTLKGDIPMIEARSRFEERLLALSRTHNLLIEQNWGRASLDRVIHDAIGHLADGRDRISLHGETLWLTPRAALSLALAFHELGTNAVKYGVLSRETGRIAIRWSVSDGMLRIEWKETGGPVVAEPGRRGFGSRLIENGIAADLGGPATLSFEPDGLRCIITASLEAVQAPVPALG